MPPAALVRMTRGTPRRPRTRIAKVTVVKRMALVEVHPAGQRHHLAAARQSADEPARVPDDVRRGPVRDVAVGHVEGLGQTIGKVAESRAQHHGHVRAAEAAAPQELRRFHGAIEVAHTTTLLFFLCFRETSRRRRR